MNKSVIGLLLVVAAAVVIGLVVMNSDDDSEPATTNSSTSSESSSNQASDASEPTNAQEINTAEVAMHNTEDDCWTIINDKVYDITSYIPRHPGGPAILQACGSDGTSLFTQRTTSDGETVGSGTPHSGGATAQLQSLFIGNLVN